jgi:hypothetical protein
MEQFVKFLTCMHFLPRKKRKFGKFKVESIILQNINYECLSESMTLRIIDTESFLLENPIADSWYRWCGESPTPRINDAGSWRLRISVMRGVGDSPYYWYAESATPRIGDSGESFFEYEYLPEFEAEIGTARKVV